MMGTGMHVQAASVQVCVSVNEARSFSQALLLATIVAATRFAAIADFLALGPQVVVREAQQQEHVVGGLLWPQKMMSPKKITIQTIITKNIKHAVAAVFNFRWLWFDFTRSQNAGSLMSTKPSS